MIEKVQHIETSKIWEEFGITQHLGGLKATRRLLEMCELERHQSILDIGCGTGFTTTLIAETLGHKVVGLDINKRLLKIAKKRITQHGLKNSVSLLNCSAQALPFASDTFDLVMAESMLIFCDAKRIFSQACQVLNKDGTLGINELTLLQSPPKDLEHWFLDLLQIRPRFRDEWEDLFRQSGFVNVRSELYSIGFEDEFLSHLKVDGVAKYSSSIIKSLVIPSLRSIFFSKETLQALIEFLPYIGYGLFVGSKN